MRSLQVSLAALVLLLSCLGTTKAMDLQTDKLNCGRAGRICPESDGTASCEGGVCKLECHDGWVLKNGICAETKAHRKGRLRQPLSLCPTGETACPIPGSKNFESFTHSHNQIADFLSAKGGYECIDTSLSLESCGGCASVGQGRDCTAIPGAVGVGCGGGECIIFSCEHGYSLSLDGTECQKKPQHRKQHLAAHLKFRSSRAV